MRSDFAGVRLTRIADWLAVATAVSLPWSTSATGILVALLVFAILPTLDRQSSQGLSSQAAVVLPLALVAYALIGTLWSEAEWPARFSGLAPFVKLLVIPLLLFHFRRTGAAEPVFIGFFASACLLLAASWVLAIFPNLPWRVAGYGVPVKDYIIQSGIFTLCIVGLLDRALMAWKDSPRPAMAYAGLSLIFFGNIVFVATGRTTVVVLVVLLVMLGWRHCRGRTLLIFLSGLVVLAAISWAASPYLRMRVSNVAVELQNFRPNEVDTSSGARVEFWKQSLELARQAPLFGHGTGSTREAMSRLSSVDPQLKGAPSNPHNQIFAIAIPLGLLGVALLIAMWLAHGRMFLVPGRVAWIGLAVVTQNVVGGFFNSHLFDFTQGWLYVMGVGVAGGVLMHEPAASMPDQGRS
ncbi:MAG: O-antigen ligase family protein [Xanthobacteraceae bacterium]